MKFAIIPIIASTMILGCKTNDNVNSSTEQLAETKPQSRIICKKITVTGSRLPIRRCGTKQEWDEEKRQGEEHLRQLQAKQQAPNLVGEQ